MTAPVSERQPLAAFCTDPAGAAVPLTASVSSLSSSAALRRRIARDPSLLDPRVSPLVASRTMKLVVVAADSPELKGRVFELDPGVGTYLLGRSPTADIVLADSTISRRHARIVFAEGAWSVVDEPGSACGVHREDGSGPVNRLVLAPRSRFRAGTVVFELRDDADLSGSPEVRSR